MSADEFKNWLVTGYADYTFKDGDNYIVDVAHVPPEVTMGLGITDLMALDQIRRTYEQPIEQELADPIGVAHILELDTQGTLDERRAAVTAYLKTITDQNIALYLAAAAPVIQQLGADVANGLRNYDAVATFTVAADGTYSVEKIEFVERASPAVDVPETLIARTHA